MEYTRHLRIVLSITVISFFLGYLTCSALSKETIIHILPAISYQQDVLMNECMAGWDRALDIQRKTNVLLEELIK